MHSNLFAANANQGSGLAAMTPAVCILSATPSVAENVGLLAATKNCRQLFPDDKNCRQKTELDRMSVSLLRSMVPVRVRMFSYR